MLALKLSLVPLFLLLVSLVGRRWGAQVAGWLAGLPIVAGPILYIVALEQGPGFAAEAASAALAAILASISFGITYARCCLRRGWPAAAMAGLLAWLAAAMLLSLLPASVLVSAPIALLALLIAPALFPRVAVLPSGLPLGPAELGLRMLAGALLTLGVTAAAAAVGPRWSGLLSVFPILSMVLAVFSHRAQGAEFAATLLRALATGMYSFLAFCLTLALALRHLGIAAAFLSAGAAALAVQVATRRRTAAAPDPRSPRNA